MRWSISVVICAGWMLASAAQAADRAVIIGLEPTLSATLSTTAGKTLADYLTTTLKHAVTSRTFKNYDELIDALVKGDIDFAWINPYAFVQATQRAKIMAVAKAVRRGESYRSVFFVRSDSKVRSLADLKGSKVAWVDRSSTAGYLFPQAMLYKANLDPAKLFTAQAFAGTHWGVCDAVLSGQVDVGATFHTGDDPTNFRPDGCIASMGPEVANKVHGIATSDPIPYEVIAARPKFNVDLALKVGGVFASMADTDAGREVLKTVFHADGFGLALDSDFDPVRAAMETVGIAQSSDEDEAELAADVAAPGPTGPATAAPGAAAPADPPKKKKRKKREEPPTVHLVPRHHTDE